MNSKTLRVIANFCVFQIGWFACVFFAAHHLPWVASLIVGLIVVAHIFLAPRSLPEIKLVVIIMLIGCVWDSALLNLGWLDFNSGILIEKMAPNWILALWALFAITLNLSLAWLKPRLFSAALLGAIAGPLAYYGAANLGAVIFIKPLFAMIALSLGWAVLTPLSLLLARRYNGISEENL